MCIARLNEGSHTYLQPTRLIDNWNEPNTCWAHLFSMIYYFTCIGYLCYVNDYMIILSWYQYYNTIW